jgi:hypothetical protein
MRRERADGADLVLADEAAVALRVRGEDGREPTLYVQCGYLAVAWR